MLTHKRVDFVVARHAIVVFYKLRIHFPLRPPRLGDEGGERR